MSTTLARAFTQRCLHSSTGSLSSLSSRRLFSSFASAFSSRAKEREKIAIIGSGNWGSTAARIVAQNTLIHSDVFEPEVSMWVHEEEVEHEGKTEKLSSLVNELKENVKYLPGIQLGANVTAHADLVTAVEGASMLVFVTPHQFIDVISQQLRGKVRPDAKGLSLIKGMDVTEDGFQLISGVVSDHLDFMDCSVLMGANIAQEIAQEEFSEATVGYADARNGALWVKAFDRPYFQVTAVQDVAGAELCGTLKNIVAIGCGFVDGMGLGNNTKSAIIRIGLQEMRKLAKFCFPSVQDTTFFESCGLADLITTCYGGRNRKCAEAYTLAGGEKSFHEIETELLNGQKLQGVLTSFEVQEVLEKQGIVDQFPLFTTINRICKQELMPEDIVRYKQVHNERERHLGSQ
jgi:glycerol-3-phosphate dehydrogenase (NAD+)